MIKKLLFAILLPMAVFPQGYTSYFTGNATNSTANPEFGICMMGGATEHDNAMIWLLEKANGGDVVVLRSSGSDGYNDYLYSELGVAVNSVETLVITSVAGATNPYVLDKVANAELLWFAGGDQYNYVSYFKNNTLEDLLNDHVNVKHAPIGGTSAGMAILGSHYFSAQNGSVTSAQALANPYHTNVTLGRDDFLSVPLLSHTITDTHYDNPDRRGRQTAFLARFRQDFEEEVNGIACNEYVAVCIDAEGKARVYGDYPNYQEFAYFIRGECVPNMAPETCQPNTPLTWNSNGMALNVYKVPGTMDGANYFYVSNWNNPQSTTVSGGSWESWTVSNGILNTSPGFASTCLLGNDGFSATNLQILPNPFSDNIRVDTIEDAKITIFDMQGRKMYCGMANGEIIDTAAFAAGVYVVSIERDGKTINRKIVKD